MTSVRVTPIATVRSPRTDRGDDDWGSVESTIEFDATTYAPDCLHGLSDFSHVEVVYRFHGLAESAVTATTRRPRNNPKWPVVGIFAQRGSARPNLIGVSRCMVLGVDGLTIRVRGLDAIDGTPVLDVKPYMREFGPIGPVRQPQWATDVMERYYG